MLLKDIIEVLHCQLRVQNENGDIIHDGSGDSNEEHWNTIPDEEYHEWEVIKMWSNTGFCEDSYISIRIKKPE